MLPKATSAKKASSASTVRLAQQNAPMRYIAGRGLQRPQTSMERRSAWMGQTVESEIDAFDGDWQGTLFSSRSAMIEGLKETLSIKTEPAKVALVKPRKLGMLRSEYSAFKGLSGASVVAIVRGMWRRTKFHGDHNFGKRVD